MIDLNHLVRQTGGDTDLEDELLTLFLTQLLELRTMVGAELTDAPTGVDLPSVLHRIRGAAAAVGAHGMVRCFSRAEAALAQRPWSRPVLDDLRAGVMQASADLGRLIAARKEPGLAKDGESR